MRAGKVIKWFAGIIAIPLILVAGTFYVQASRIPENYRPAKLTAQQKQQAVKLFWKKFLGEFNDRAQSDAPYYWAISEEQLNGWLAAADEIAASRPSGKAGEVTRAMQEAGLVDPAVSLRSGMLTLMVRSGRYDKILSADLSFSFTADRKLRVSLVEARIGRLVLPNAWVHGRINRLKRLVPIDKRTHETGSGDPEKSASAGLSPVDVASVLGAVLTAIDAEPIETELSWPVNGKHLRIDRAEIQDDTLRLHVVPLGRRTPR